MFYVQAIGDAVDVIEVGYHLRGIMNGAIVKAIPAQGFDILFKHGLGGVCQFDGVGAEGGVSFN